MKPSSPVICLRNEKNKTYGYFTDVAEWTLAALEEEASRYTEQKGRGNDR